MDWVPPFDAQAIRAEIAALDTLPTAERLAALRRLAMEVLPHVLSASNWPSLLVVGRTGGQILVRCSHCGQEHWRADEGIWFALPGARWDGSLPSDRYAPVVVTNDGSLTIVEYHAQPGDRLDTICIPPPPPGLADGSQLRIDGKVLVVRDGAWVEEEG